jgi:methylated-DNA-[protein]-cysteine S-methyltransferase
MEYSFFSYPSPLGILNIRFTERGVLGISFLENEQNINNCNKAQVHDADLIVYKYLFKELNNYFLGRLKKFEVPIILQGTEFQIKVWQEILKIPYGESKTYGEIARSIGMPDSARAVGRASHENKIPIIIPCHRVIGVNGKLTGYASGLDKKQWLLKHEQKHKEGEEIG